MQVVVDCPKCGTKSSVYIDIEYEEPDYDVGMYGAYFPVQISYTECDCVFLDDEIENLLESQDVRAECDTYDEGDE